MNRSFYMNICNLFLTIVVLYFPNHLSGSTIRLDRGGYKGILVAFKQTTQEDILLIQNIKEMFIKGSEFLHRITGGRAFYEEVTIAIPSTWRNLYRNYEISLSDYFSFADIRIDAPNPEYGDSPYTLQVGGCGEPGQYIHFTPKFIRNVMDGKYGSPEKQLVHHWTHLRYGVFDEYGVAGDPKFPMFYPEDGKFLPSTCNKGIKGWMVSKDGGKCSIMASGYINEDCVFFPNKSHQDVIASIMFMPNMLQMNSFCDTKKARLHNTRAPTPQNVFCNYKSIWEVVTSHFDFKKSTRKRRKISIFKPTFRIVKHEATEPHIVFVLHLSRNLKGYPIELLHDEVLHFLEIMIPDGAYFGIVESKVLNDLEKVTTNSRKTLIGNFPSPDYDFYEGIEIGKRIKLGYQVLNNNPLSTATGGVIMLITDADNTALLSLREAIPDLENKKIIVNIIAIGNNASSELDNIAMRTGGKFCFLQSLQESKQIYSLHAAFLETVLSQIDIDFHPVTIDIQDELDVQYDSITLWIEKELGKNTIFIATTSTGPFDLVVVGPLGDRYISQQSSGYKRVIIPNAKSGMWKVSFQTDVLYPMKTFLIVTSEPNDIRKQPIRIKLWLSDLELKLHSFVKIYVEVKKGYDAVIGARVIAVVTRPVGKPVTVSLKDNGIGADRLKYDGIYSANFIQYSGDGRYVVVAKMRNYGEAVLKTGSRTLSSNIKPKFPINTEWLQGEGKENFTFNEDYVYNITNSRKNKKKKKGVRLGKVQRFSTPRVFTISSWQNIRRNIPPGSITDLEVISIAVDKKYVTLEWTSPGADFDIGNVTSIQLRADSEPEMLQLHFDQVFLFNTTLLIEGTLDPLPVGMIQTVTIQIPHDFLWENQSDASIYFAVRGIDEDGNISPSYNIAEANFGVERLIRSLQQMRPFMWWKVVLGTGIAFLLISLVMLGIFYRKKKANID